MPPKNGIELELGKLVGEVAATRDLHKNCRANLDRQICKLTERVTAIERKLYLVTGAAAMVGAMLGEPIGSFLSKLIAGASAVAEAGVVL